MSGIFTHASLLVACLIIVRCAAGPTKGNSKFFKQPKTYFIEHTIKKMKFFQSFQYCMSKGMRIATFESEEEFKQLSVVIESAGFSVGSLLWLGGSDLAQRGVWRWYSSGSLLDFLPWGPGEPRAKYSYSSGEESRCVAVERQIDGPVIIEWLCSFYAYPICEY